MNGIPRFVGFVHQNLSQIVPLRDPNSVQIMEYPIRLIHKMGSIMVDSFLLQSSFSKTRMMGFANEGFEMMLGWNITSAMQIASSA
ncbi:hypothetical protein HanRHA438_Chr13g0580801 [Helianthus annuus]|nr:hypothetical protein HanRHA438_Chr13g0580801 [Helianthus annuus]